MSRMLLGAGGSNRAFSPGDVSSLWLWLDAPSLGLANDAAVSAWPNKIGGVGFIQSTAGSRPTYKTGIQNGKAVVRFDGTADYMRSSAVRSLTQPATIFVVAQRTGNYTAYSVVFSQATEAMALGFDVSADEWYAYTNPALIDQVAADDAFHYLMALENGAGSIMRADGTQKAAALDAGNVSGDTIVIGATSGAAAPLAGDIGELIVYEAALSAAQILQVENYLKSKWGL